MKIQLLLILVLLSSCSSNVRTLSTRMLSPEANGKLGKGSVEARVQSYSNSRLNFENETIGNPVEKANDSNSIGGYGDLGIVRKLDFYLLANSNNSPNLYGAKYQFLGDTKDKADKGNFSLATSVGYGSTDNDVGRNDLDDISANVKRLKTYVQHLEAGLLLGYRWHKKLLNYLNIIYFDETLDGKVTTETEQLKYRDFKYTQTGMIYSGGFMYVGSHLHFKLDFSHMVAQWSKTSGNQTANTMGGAFGFSW